MSPFQKPRKDSSPGRFDHSSYLSTWMIVSPPGSRLTSRGSRYLRTPDEFEVDGAASTWRIERENPLDVGNLDITEGIYARAGRLALDTRMADVRATQLLAALPGDTEFLLRIKFLREKAEDDWVLEDKFDPVLAERKKGRGSSRSLGTQALGY